MSKLCDLGVKVGKQDLRNEKLLKWGLTNEDDGVKGCLQGCTYSYLIFFPGYDTIFLNDTLKLRQFIANFPHHAFICHL